MRWALLVLLLAATFGLSTARAENTGGIRGTVVGVHTNRPPGPIKNALVIAISGSVIASTFTDAKGFFVFMSLPPGLVNVNVTAGGYSSVIAPVCVMSGVFRTLPIVLIPGGGLSQMVANERYNESLQYRPDPGITGDLYSLSDC